MNHGMSISTDLKILGFVWTLVVLYFIVAYLLLRRRNWHDNRRARMSVRTARGLGTKLLADEAALKRGTAPRRSRWSA